MPFASKEVHWKDAGYDGPLPDGTVLLHSSASCTASTGLYTFKLIHGSIAESASRFGVNTKKNMTSSDAAKAAALTRIKKGEIETFEVLLRHINKSDAGNGMEEDPGEEDGGMAAAGAATHHAPRAGQGQRASSYSPHEQLHTIRQTERVQGSAYFFFFFLLRLGLVLLLALLPVVVLVLLVLFPLPRRQQQGHWQHFGREGPIRQGRRGGGHDGRIHGRCSRGGGDFRSNLFWIFRCLLQMLWPC